MEEHWLKSEILEVMFEDAEPRFVWIEAGTEQGIVEGMSGELVEGEHSIGEIEVLEIFEEGSRARILGALSEEITLDTMAVINLSEARR